MLINNSEALKCWLIIVLEPMCDADSSALARYVLALLKKDKPEKDLKQIMNDQLDVFLGEETHPFVERLFHAINTEEYLQPATTSAVKRHEPATPIQHNASVSATIATNKFDFQNEQSSVTTELKSANMTSSSGGSGGQSDRSHGIVEENKTKESQNNHRSSDNTDRNSIHHSSKSSFDNTHSVAPGNASSSHQIRSASPTGKVNPDKENQPRESRRRRASLRSRSRSRTRSRSRSNERFSRRSRSRDRRPNEREKNRQFRNKSPPTADARHAGPHERRRGGPPANDRRRPAGHMADDRSPRFSTASNDNRKSRMNRSNSRSRSPSVDRVRIKTSPNSRNTRTSPDRHHQPAPLEMEKRQRCRDFDEKGYCVRGETCPWDHGINPVVFEGLNNPSLLTMSLREYNPDVPDLWNRNVPPGSMPGGNPLVPPGGVPGPAINPFSGSNRPGAVMVSGGGGIAFPHVGPVMDKAANGAGGGGVMPADYARNMAAAGTGFRAVQPLLNFPFNPSVTTPLQRELIPIPVVDTRVETGGDISAMQQGKRRFDLEDTVAIAEGPTKRKLPINSRLGPRVPNVQNNCSLELRKVPRGLNTIAHLNNHFAKFGKIVNIQISYDGDPEAAIVTFSTHAEANVAYRSTEAVLNNRFIKVFWHSLDSNSNHGDSGNMSINSGRKNSQYHLNNIPAMPTPNADSAKTTNIASTSHPNPATSNISTNATTPVSAESIGTANAPIAATTPSLRIKNNVARNLAPGSTNAIIRKKQEEQAKAVVQLANGLRKRKQELLQSYLKQMKSALELVERCDQNDPQRGKTLETIKELQEKIDKLRKEIAAEQEQMQAQMQNQQPMAPKKTKEQQKKELLDIELELFAQQQEGNDTTAIQKRLEELQRSLGIALGSVAGSGSVGSNKSGAFQSNRGNPRSRPTYPEGSTRVDRRPTTIVVTGFASDEADFVLGHFKHFGEITKHDVDKQIPQLILSFSTRINAEQAILRGKFYKDKRLQISWAPNMNISPNAQNESNKNGGTDVAKQATRPSNASDIASVESDVTPDILPELRLEDEEEDDESEDRSWRR